MARKPISKKLRFDVLHRDGFACRYCGASGEGVTLHLDHVVPVAKGGKNEADNLLTACEPCNLGKGITDLKAMPLASGGQPLPCPFAEGWPNEITDPVFAIYGDWAVTGYGLESLASYYPIPRERLNETRMGTNLSDWLLHMAEKEWVAIDLDEFEDAFADAARRHVSSPAFDLLASLKKARWIARETLGFSRKDAA